ncbi:MAG: thioredoxin [Desulfobulbaceae bacterium]|nr:thioredoxin [Desulfobulbaceae bacterium]
MNQRTISCPACGAKNRIPAEKSHLQPKCGRCGRKLDLSSGEIVVDLDDTGFERFVSRSSIPVMVDFFSPTCGPCQTLTPVIKVLAQQYAGKVNIAKLDTSRYQMTAGKYGIRGVPTLIFFKNGKVADQVVGAVPHSEIERRLNSLL